MQRHGFQWLMNLGLPLALLTLAWGCGGTATPVYPLHAPRPTPGHRRPVTPASPTPIPRNPPPPVGGLPVHAP